MEQTGTVEEPTRLADLLPIGIALEQMSAAP